MTSSLSGTRSNQLSYEPFASGPDDARLEARGAPHRAAVGTHRTNLVPATFTPETRLATWPAKSQRATYDIHPHAPVKAVQEENERRATGNPDLT